MAGPAAVVVLAVEVLVEAGNKLPSFAAKVLNQEDYKEIDQFIQSCEIKTSAEIVVCLVSRSSSVRHVPWILSLLMMLVFLMLLLGFILQGFEALFFDHWLMLSIFACAIPIVAFKLSEMSVTQRWLTPDADEIEQVERRAILEFYSRKLDHTKDRNAILVLISAMERRAVILADQSISSKIDASVWDSALKALLVKIKNGSIKDGIKICCSEITQKLEAYFPADNRTGDQIKSHFIVVD